ncbi:hypothetical protein L486_00310 [Kwoniella mangroviensis CBS 10435]|uniref:Uncharacterized protein n=1 Tax=Kwoniella mangroviensis CBS 10435 TaxID=1331196 RepID=A0A1B9IZ33_9TREE|nr:uncharacterized protein I203_06370 [Kwoniella mangroviensis CBS 8507]OCF60674.1 hypothetical protein L486_00310 [Kwoniella mangroviensis CBS 10435]OCF64635.1 hypothetical protein I203_06370 [Kwoniella mangroviensis CBS 8507]OCF74577.1 hypothetical protein I204_04956 [Kwoniella mangroviensis CBS 8886]
MIVLFLLITHLTFISALPFSLITRASDVEKEDESLYDQVSTSSSDWCTDNPENCKTVVSISSIIGLLLVCYLIYRFWKKRRIARKEEESMDRTLKLNKEKEEIKQRAIEEHQHELQGGLFKAFGLKRDTADKQNKS